MFCTFWLVNVLSATAACHFSTIFRHLHVKKWPESVSFLRFWLENVPLATAACNFSTSQLQKVVRARQFFSILTWKCTSRYSGVQFFHIATSKSGPNLTCFVHFDWKCASRYSGVQFFMSSLNSHLRTRRFTEVTFRPSRHTNHWKTQHFATSLTFRACVSSFFWLYFSSLLFQLSILSEVRLLNFLRLGVYHHPKGVSPFWKWYTVDFQGCKLDASLKNLRNHRHHPGWKLHLTKKYMALIR